MSNRDEQIEKAANEANKDGAGPSDTCHNCLVFRYAGFIQGAKWADQNPIKYGGFTDDLMATQTALEAARLALEFYASTDPWRKDKDGDEWGFKVISSGGGIMSEPYEKSLYVFLTLEKLYEYLSDKNREE